MAIKLDQTLVRKAINDYTENNLSIVECASKYNIGATTLTRYLKKEGIDTSYDTRKYSYNERFFQTIDTEQKAYWLGFIAADGSIINNGSVLQITLQLSDKEHLERFIKDIDGDSEMVKERSQKANGKEYPAARVNVCSKILCNDLFNKGITPRKGFVLDFPDLNKEMLKHYLRGYFDGDGSISTNGKYRKGDPKYAINIIATEKFLEEFIVHMFDYGITRVKLQSKGPMKVWNKCGINQILSVFHYLYDNSNVYLERKYQYFISICRHRSRLTEDL